MSPNNDKDMTLSADDAFAVLGNETRMNILQTLGETDSQLSFSELRDRVGMRDSGQFNYHLDQLTGHYIRKTDDGYSLLQPGRRMIEAVLSGVVTEMPAFESTQLDDPCSYCGAPTVIAYDPTTPRSVRKYCTECAGAADWSEQVEHGVLGTYPLPPAGLNGRTPQEVDEAGSTWEHLEYLSAVVGLCPRCSAVMEHSISVCEPHDPDADGCPHCNRPYAAQLSSSCTNCHFGLEDQTAATIVLGSVEMLSFMTDHGVNPITDPVWTPLLPDASEEILSTDPFQARFTFTLDGETLSLTIGDDLSVIGATKNTASERA